MIDPSLVKIERATIVYPELFEPTLYGNETEPKYRAVFLIDKTEDLKPLRNACREAAQRKFGTGIDLKTLRFPIRDGNEKAIDENGNPDPTNFYYNRVFMSAKSKYQIPIVDYYNQDITDSNQIYGGCIVQAYVSFYGYAYMGNGVACGLRAVCKLEDGDPLGGGRVNTEELFKDVLKPRDTFDSNPPVGQERLDNELGQQNHNPLADSNPWGEKPQREPGDEDDIGF